METIASFQIDHTKLKPGLYVSRVDEYPVECESYVRRCPSCKGSPDTFTVTTFDLRFVTPNVGEELDTAVIHTIEHLGVTFLRNVPGWKDHVIYFGPMGCRTGFYLVLAGDFRCFSGIGNESEIPSVRVLITEMLKSITRRYFEDGIPGATPEECGNYKDHDYGLDRARFAADRYLQILFKESSELGYDQFKYPE